MINQNYLQVELADAVLIIIMVECTVLKSQGYSILLHLGDSTFMIGIALWPCSDPLVT